MIIDDERGPEPGPIANQIIVKIAAGLSDDEVAAVREAFGATLLETTKTLGFELWAVPQATLGKVLAGEQYEDVIEYAQPNGVRSIQRTIPDDPQFGKQWSLDNQGQTGGVADADIDAPEAWDTTTGNGVVVALNDTGIDYNHPDLDANIWVNPDEIADNGIDDDGNGFVDDVHGYDFVNEDNDPFDDYSHGTHVAGTIAAEADNGIGVAGIAWDAQLMALKCFNAGGFGSDFDIIQAIEYSILEGARVSNNSYGGGGFSQPLRDAIQAAGEAGQLFVLAAGNDYGNDNDAAPVYPASYDLDNIVAVAATDASDRLADFSNYGATSVDLGAPGKGVLSTVPGGGYDTYSGTSMATPHVVGVAALLLSQQPDLTVEELKALILDKTDPLASLDGITVSGGRLNAANAVGAILPPTEVIGTDGDDDLSGTDARNIIRGLGGDDLISGLAGADQLFGGDGSDFISSGSGNDTVKGNAGDDVVLGDAGDDVLSGGSGNDDIAGGADNDAITGGAGDDRLLGNDGNDQLFADEGNDRADGGPGNDEIAGGAGDDRASGGTGNDVVRGGEGDDSVAGGTGNDTVTGGAGADRIAGFERDAASGWGKGELDRLEGGAGRDIFELGTATAVGYQDGSPTGTGEGDFATISDFDASSDSIELGGTRSQYLLDFYRTAEGVLNADLVYDIGSAARGDRIATLERVDPGLTLGNPAFVYLGDASSGRVSSSGGTTDEAQTSPEGSPSSAADGITAALAAEPVSITLPVNLTDGGGFNWDIQRDGTISDGTNDAYDGGLRLSSFPAFEECDAEDDGREIVIGPADADGIQVVRKIHVPTDGNWARFLEIVTNTGTAEASFTVALVTNLGSDSETTVIGTSSGDKAFDVSDQWLVTDDVDAAGDPTMLHVIGDATALAASDASIDADNLAFRYDLKLAPGQTQIIMHFASQTPDQSSALALAPTLAGLGGETLEGLSAEELAGIVNFSLFGSPIVGTGRHDVLAGTSRGELIEGRGGNDVIEGLAGRDRLYGQDGGDIVIGGDGSDLISGGAGDDLLSGEAGNDQVAGDAGDDVLTGGSGDDVLDGGGGSDRLLGEDGHDTLRGGGGSDRALGGAGDDEVDGGAGQDVVDGGLGDDVLRGGGGNDRLAAGEGRDVLEGGSGTDVLEGGAGDDSLDGGSGGDRLMGVDSTAAAPGSGEIDVLVGGLGADVFVFGRAGAVFYVGGSPASTGEDDYARVLDFDSRVDSVELVGAPNLYRLDFFATAEGRLDAALIYDTPEGRGNLVAVLEGVSDTLRLSDPAFTFPDFLAVPEPVSGSFGGGGPGWLLPM